MRHTGLALIALLAPAALAADGTPLYVDMVGTHWALATDARNRSPFRSTARITAHSTVRNCMFVCVLSRGSNRFTPVFVAIDQFTLIHSIWFIAMIIVGGMGSVTGALIGVFVIRLSQELITSIGPSLIERYPFFSGEIVFAAMNIFLGGMIAGFLILEPRGLMHRWNTLKRAYRLWPYPY